MTEFITSSWVKTIGLTMLLAIFVLPATTLTLHAKKDKDAEATETDGEGGKKSKKAKGSKMISGKVVKVDAEAKTITIETKKDGEMTFKVTDATKITINKEEAKLADLDGQKAVGIQPKEKGSDEAAAIMVQSKKKKDKDASPEES